LPTREVEADSRRLRSRLERNALEPGPEGAVEELDVVVPRDERRTQRPVDVVPAGEVDLREPDDGVGEPARADLESRLA
jgi:hypothetical protein